MGVGNRFKKQGPPEPLSEAHFAKLKRKAGLPVDEPTEAPQNKRRRASKQQAAAPPAKKAKSAKGTNGAKADAAVTPAVNPRSKPKKGKKAKVVEEEAELSDDDDMADLAASDDDLSGLDGDATLGDDFLGSDDSVFDSDDPEQEQNKHVFSEDEDDSDGEEALSRANLEGLSRKLDEQAAQEAEDAAAELEEMGLQTNIAETGMVLDDDNEDPKKKALAPDLHVLRNRMTDNVRILEDFAKLADPGRSRSEYTAQLIKDICGYYGYSEYLAEKLFNLFSPSEAFSFFEANESPRPIVIRTNTLRTHRRDLAQSLISRGVVLEPVGKWSKVGLQVFESSIPLGASPEYLAGHYILQAASSFLPVMALGPQENERVLDMAAAPGGKTTHMAAMMKNKGFILANDPNKARAKGLIGNIHRLGARNVVVSNYDAREFPKPMGGFDRVLLDAPCSGTGVIAKDPSVKTNKTERDFMMLPHMQKQLLLAAIDSVNHNSKTGGFVVYSTCSVTIEENEAVVQYALSRRPNVKLVDTGLPFGKEGFTSYMGKKFDASLKLTRRYYPHTYNVDGFFVSKFQKVGPTPAKAVAGPADADRLSVATKNGRRGGAQSGGFDDDSAPVDRTPIGAEEGAETSDDGFGGFDDDEDEGYMLKAKRNAMRRRGLDPHALDKGAANAKGEKKGENKTQEEGGRSKKANKAEAEAEEPVVAAAAVEEKKKKKAPKGEKKTKKPADEVELKKAGLITETAEKVVPETKTTPEKKKGKKGKKTGGK
ncbi:rRNA (cytosine-C5-)-methyltransferase nop2 [Verticillium nonalfalfae]|uniref:Nucleolar protein 2 n=1 Tax=Verticillium nonalfalfae TaxID=1051616 RepID=A0A3M9XZK0_9PEZI|nr:rRNA (cytosine-C5-)-methyltransferase nop2 [Verticillium nonalfalfae]RNJ53086.1 rRNA (cytosine-C5-)-methyltransferase nop2 [Verticillium nonalfalfae]